LNLGKIPRSLIEGKTGIASALDKKGFFVIADILKLFLRILKHLALGTGLNLVADLLLVAVFKSRLNLALGLRLLVGRSASGNLEVTVGKGNNLDVLIESGLGQLMKVSDLLVLEDEDSEASLANKLGALAVLVKKKTRELRSLDSPGGLTRRDIIDGPHEVVPALSARNDGSLLLVDGVFLDQKRVLIIAHQELLPSAGRHPRFAVSLNPSGDDEG
jgi:hypothetical protein